MNGVAGEKLQKVLAELGYGSRRKMEGWIQEGRIKVNGELAHLGQRVVSEDNLQLDNRPLTRRSRDVARVLVVNKAAGVICTRSDPEGRPTLYADLPRLKRGRWIAVGRLDIATTGLLLVTNDGALANRLMHPSTGLDREYAVRVTGHLTDDQVQTLLDGVVIEGEQHRFSDLKHFNGRGVNHWYHVVLMEGKNREVRRLFEALGFMVSRLKRVRYGPVVLPANLPRGRFAELAADEVKMLYKIVGLAPPQVLEPRGRGPKKKVSMLLPYPQLPKRENR